MAAVFLTLGDDIFMTTAGTPTSFVSCDLLDADSLFAPGQCMLLSNFSTTFNEVVQFFQSFDDLIHYYYFGKGLGQIRFDMMAFFNCSGDAPGLRNLYESIGSKRGKKVTLDFMNVHVEGILMEFNITALAEPLPHFQISIALGMINSNLTPPNIQGGC